MMCLVGIGIGLTYPWQGAMQGVTGLHQPDWEGRAACFLASLGALAAQPPAQAPERVGGAAGCFELSAV